MAPGPGNGDAEVQVAMQMAVVVCESLLYGVFLVLFCTMLYMRSGTRSRSGRGLTAWLNVVEISSLAMLLLATAHWVVTVAAFFSAFLDSDATSIDAIYGVYFGRLTQTQTTNAAVTLAAIAIGDAVLIHRLWVVWNRDVRITIFPLTVWCGLVLCGSAVVYLLSRLPAHASIAALDGWTTANWLLTTLTSVYCTGFMAWRIWQAVRATRHKEKTFMSVLIVLVESAAIWMTWTTFFTVVHLTNLTVQLIGNALAPPIIGIANMLIYIRVALASPAHRTASNVVAPDVVITNNASIVGASALSSTLEGTPYGGYEMSLPLSEVGKI